MLISLVPSSWVRCQPANGDVRIFVDLGSIVVVISMISVIPAVSMISMSLV